MEQAYNNETVIGILGMEIANLKIENAKLVAIIEELKRRDSEQKKTDVKNAADELNKELRKDNKYGQ